jgi:hypothetical protein
MLQAFVLSRLPPWFRKSKFDRGGAINLTLNAPRREPEIASPLH